MSDNLKGSLLTEAAMTGFALNDAFVKAVSDELGLSQALFLRGIFVTGLFLVIGRSVGALGWPAARSDQRMLVLRSVAETVATFIFLTALFHMPIDNATAILQALPLSVTLGAALVFGEALGWRRLTAVGVAFLGVLLIVRPGMEGLSVYSLFALVAVVLITVRELAARKMSRAVSSFLAATGSSALVTLAFGIGAAFGDWAPVSPLAAAQLSGAVALIFVGYFFSVAAVRVGEIGAVALFRYTALLVALAVGVFVFGKWPGPLTLLGTGIVVATGIFTLMRKRAVRWRRPG